MPAWIETQTAIVSRNGDYDGVRRDRIRVVEDITHRPLIVYATAFLERNKVAASQGEIGIDSTDPIGFDEVISPISGDNLDVLLHSPGGSPEAAESIVALLRSRFKNLRFIVPHMAKSAATMICCAGNEILMDERSELGPIDPQMQLIRGDKVPVSAPAQAILEQFDKAKKSLATNPNQIAAWLPILQLLAPSLLTECESANDLSLNLVKEWLEKHMFCEEKEPKSMALTAAEYLANSKIHLSHGRRIGLEQLINLNLKVTDLRTIPNLREAIWNLYLAISMTFQETNAFKIIESCHGTAFIRNVIVTQIQIPPGQILPVQPTPKTAPGKRRRH